MMKEFSVAHEPPVTLTDLQRLAHLAGVYLLPDEVPMWRPYAGPGTHSIWELASVFESAVFTHNEPSVGGVVDAAGNPQRPPGAFSPEEHVEGYEWSRYVRLPAVPALAKIEPWQSGAALAECLLVMQASKPEVMT